MSGKFVPHFDTICPVTLVLGPENLPGSLVEEAVLTKNGFKYGKKIFHTVICLKIPFYPYQPSFGPNEVYFFFFLSFPFFPVFSFFFILKVRIDWTRSDSKQPKFDVIDSSRKVATGRNLREQLRNIACLQVVVR